MNLEKITPEPEKKEPVFSQENFPFLIQAQLIENSKIDPELWIKQYAAKFRELIESDPALFRKYLLNPEETENFIKAELNKPETIH